MAITTTQFTNIADDLAKIIVDMETAFITNPGTNAPTNTTINNGAAASSNSLLARFNALSTGDKAGQMGFQIARMVNAPQALTALAKTQIYAYFAPYLEALDYDIGGVYSFINTNSLVVHPEFAAAFNWMSANGRTLGLRPYPVQVIQPSQIFTSVEVVLGSIAVTGATTGTFTAGTALDLTKYGPAQLYLKNTAGSGTTGTATVFGITYTNAAGQTGQTTTQALSGSLGAGATLAVSTITGSAVSNITVNSSGSTGDAIAVTIEPTRTIAY